MRYPPPPKGYLSDTSAIPYENKANGCDTPPCDTISKGYCAIWGGISHWAAKRGVFCDNIGVSLRGFQSFFFVTGEISIIGEVCAQVAMINLALFVPDLLLESYINSEILIGI